MTDSPHSPGPEPLAAESGANGTSRTQLIVIGAVIAGLVIRLVNLDHAALWFDEVFTAQHMERSFAGIIAAVFSGVENSLPGYLLVLKTWTNVAGDSTWALRLPSVLASCVAIPFVAMLTRDIAGESAARWAAWLAALSPYLVHHAQEARMYAFFLLLAATSLALFARFLSREKSSLGLLYMVVTAALLLTHYYAVLLVAAQLMTLMLVRPRPVGRWLPAAAAVSAVALVIVGFALFVAARNAGEQYDIGLLALPGLVWAMIGGYALLPGSAELHRQGLAAALPFLPVAILGAIAFVPVFIAGLRRLRDWRLVLVLCVLLMGIAAPVAAAFVFGIGVNPRYCVAAAPVLIAVMGNGIHELWAGPAGRAAGVAILAVVGVGTGLHLAEPGHGRADVRAAAAWLDEHVPVDENILVSSREMYFLVSHHWPQRRFALYPDRRTVVTDANVADVINGLPAGAAGRLIYVFGRDWISDPNGHLYRALRETYPTCGGLEARGVSILCLKTDGDGPVE